VAVLERLVIDVILKMGYGGLPEDAAKLVARVATRGSMGLSRRTNSVST